MRVTFRIPDCDDWTDEDLVDAVEQGTLRYVKVTNMLRWDHPVTRGKIIAAVRDGHDALVTIETPDHDDADLMAYLRAGTGNDAFSIGPHETVETTGNGPEVPGSCGFVRDPLRLFEVSVRPSRGTRAD